MSSRIIGIVKWGAAVAVFLALALPSILQAFGLHP